MTERQAREALGRMERGCPKPGDGDELLIWAVKRLLTEAPKPKGAETPWS